MISSFLSSIIDSQQYSFFSFQNENDNNNNNNDNNNVQEFTNVFVSMNMNTMEAMAMGIGRKRRRSFVFCGGTSFVDCVMQFLLCKVAKHMRTKEIGFLRAYGEALRRRLLLQFEDLNGEDFGIFEDEDMFCDTLYKECAMAL